MTNKFLSRRSFIIGLSILSVVLLGCLENQMNYELPSAIYKHWIHSREEDAEDVRVYRPSDYKFPPSRGREGFEIKENGEFIQYGIGPTDAPEKIIGTWTIAGENQIIVSLEVPRQNSYTMEVVSCDERLLKVRLGL